MAVDLTGRSFLKLLDYTPEEIEYLIDLSARLKKEKKEHKNQKVLEGRNVALIFEKTSTRTRSSFEVAAHDLGMGTTYLDPSGSQIGKKESIKDTARVLGRMFDGIEYRGFHQSDVECLAEYSGVPVWNGLTDEYHPTQMIADMLTVKECFGHLKGITLTFFGDTGFNMGNSLMVACSKLGMNYRACGAAKYFPDDELVDECKKICKTTGGSVLLTEDPEEGARGADVLYTDVWVSMGEPEEVWKERLELLKPYQINSNLMDLASTDAIFMHCLPAYHDLGTAVGRAVYEKYGMKELEVTDEVFESARSRVFDEAENRMHSIKAIMYATLGADGK